MVHPYHMHREQQVSHRRVGPLLKDEPDGAKQHATGNPFSKVTSKTAAMDHDDVAGGKSAKRFARGGKVKKAHGHQTNIAIVTPGAGAGAKPPLPGGPPMGAAPPMPPPGPGAPPMAGPAGLPPGMPMRARGGKIDGEATKANNTKWSQRAEANSYMRGGAATGVGREEKAAMAKKRK